MQLLTVQSAGHRIFTFIVRICLPDDCTGSVTVIGELDLLGEIVGLIIYGQVFFIRVVGYGNSQNEWNSYTEIEVWKHLEGDQIHRGFIPLMRAQ